MISKPNCFQPCVFIHQSDGKDTCIKPHVQGNGIQGIILPDRNPSQHQPQKKGIRHPKQRHMAKGKNQGREQHGMAAVKPGKKPSQHIAAENNFLRRRGKDNRRQHGNHLIRPQKHLAGRTVIGFHPAGRKRKYRKQRRKNNGTAKACAKQQKNPFPCQILPVNHRIFQDGASPFLTAAVKDKKRQHNPQGVVKITAARQNLLCLTPAKQQHTKGHQKCRKTQIKKKGSYGIPEHPQALPYLLFHG